MPRRKQTAEAGNPTYKLDDEVRREIVTRLALYERPSDIHRDLEGRGIKISQQAIKAYDPTTMSHTPAKKWVDLFNATREAFLQETATVAIAHRAVRIHRLEQLYHRALDNNERREAAGYLEQAAKEMGNVFTNVSKTSGMIGVAHVIQERTPEESRNILVDKLTEALARLPKPAKVIEQRDEG